MTDKTPSLRTSADWREKIKILEAEQVQLKDRLDALTDARAIATIENRAETTAEKQERIEAASRLAAVEEALVRCRKREYETRLEEQAAAETKAEEELEEKTREYAQRRVFAAECFDVAAELLNNAMIELRTAGREMAEAYLATGHRRAPRSTDLPGRVSFVGALMTASPDLADVLDIARVSQDFRRPLAELMAETHKGEMGA